jgi:hypothetical protein
MAKAGVAKSLGMLSSEIYDLMEGLKPDERARVMSSVSRLFGDVELTPNSSNGGLGESGFRASNSASEQHGPRPEGAQKFFEEKQPKNKGEMLAVAARYREETGSGDSHTVEDLIAVFGEARRNFDRRNFLRDMINAQRQAHLFTRGTPRGEYQLSYYGQQYVDALPDREKLKKIARPRGRVKKGKAAKRAHAK